MTRSARSLPLTLLAASLSASAGAQNLLLNGSFDTNISSWDQNEPGAGTTVFSPLDAGGSASSGSVLVTNNQAVIGGNPGVFQCRAATPGASYD